MGERRKGEEKDEVGKKPRGLLAREPAPDPNRLRVGAFHRPSRAGGPGAAPARPHQGRSMIPTAGHADTEWCQGVEGRRARGSASRIKAGEMSRGGRALPCSTTSGPLLRLDRPARARPARHSIPARRVLAHLAGRDGRGDGAGGQGGRHDDIWLGRGEGEEKRGVRRKRRSSCISLFFYHDTGLSYSPPLTHTWRPPSPPAPSARPLAR
jgi:hypothetical protein